VPISTAITIPANPRSSVNKNHAVAHGGLARARNAQHASVNVEAGIDAAAQRNGINVAGVGAVVGGGAASARGEADDD
jgi:hypothetical protein